MTRDGAHVAIEAREVISFLARARADDERLVPAPPNGVARATTK